MTDFPILQARTARFTLGRPRSFTVAPGGSRVLFLRSRGGFDRVNCLWAYDVATASERLVADPLALLTTPDDEELPASERARRERAREQAGGIVGYSTDSTASVAAFALAGQLCVADVRSGDTRLLGVQGPVFDPRVDPTGRRVAYVQGGRVLRFVGIIDGDPPDVELAGEADVSWGVAEFVAAEEMDRQRGFWWAPDGESLLACRVDESPVQRWHIGDPATPDREPAAVAYPAAGTPNAEVSLWLVNLDATRIPIIWDSIDFPYLVDVRWRAGHPPLLRVASRDQRVMQTLDVDVYDGVTTLVRQDRDPHWLEIVPGVPDRARDGVLVSTADIGDTRRLVVNESPVSPEGLQVRGVVAVTDDAILFSASEEPTEQHLWSFSFDSGECVALTTAPGTHGGAAASDVVVVAIASLSDDAVRTVVTKAGAEVGVIESFAEPAPFTPNVSISRQGERELRTALVLPQGHVAGTTLPVLMDPYGGPHAQRVTSSRLAYLTPQWLADQGFAVVIVDGRGTPGRGPAWERAIAGDLATRVLDDQIDALHALAATNPDLDLSRVAIRGWSFGGYLAALAVLRRPDVFHAAVAGAPVTDWRLYDTYYTERYLGTDPTGADAPAYEACSLIADAAALRRPLLLVHGLADDNVVAAHTLRLSSALLAAGRPHQVLPLSGITHMASREDVAANLLNLEVEFLRNALATP